MSNLGRIVAAFIAVIFVILFPLQYIAQSNNENIDTIVDGYTQELSDSIREKGYLDKSMYEEYVKLLDSTGELYDVELEDIHPVSGEEVSSADTAENGFMRASIKDSLSSISSKGLLENSLVANNTAFSSSQILSLSTHTHTNDCYAGHRHNNSCLAAQQDLLYFDLTIPTTKYYSRGDDYNNRKYNDPVYYMFLSGDERIYKKIPLLYYYTVYFPQTPDHTRYFAWYKASVSATGKIIYNRRCVVVDDQIWTDYYPSTISLAEMQTLASPEGLDNFLRKYAPYYNSFLGDVYAQVQANYSNILDLTSLASYVYICGQTQDETPICNQVVTSITATNPYQTVKQGEGIITTATATMLDGSTQTVNCSVSGYNNNQVGNQTVTLTYYGLVGNAKTYGSRSCAVNVTVINPKVLTSISVTPSSQTINRYGTPTFTVMAYYSDGTSTYLSNDQYVMSALDSSVGGPHTVCFSYTENGITSTAYATVCVDVLTSIFVTPSNLTVERYTGTASLPITVTATYLYSSSRVVTSGCQISNYNPSILGEQNIYISYTENGITQSANAKVQVTVLHKTCPRCGTVYDLNTDDIDPGCPHCKQLITGITVAPDNVEIKQGESIPITVTATYADESSRVVSGWTSNFNTNKTGSQLVTIEYGGYAADITVWVQEAVIVCPICSKEYPASYGRCPYCAERVISISASPNEVTVNQYDNINLTVTAYHADGSSEEVTDWSIDYDTSVAGTFEATVSYKSITTKIKLTVISSTAFICLICGTVYEPAQNPKGCPICSSLLTGIEAYMTNGNNKVQYGTSPDVSVVLIFRDSHRELKTEGFTIENYDSNKLGNQSITIRYDKYYVIMDIEVVNTLPSFVCPICGNNYYLNEDGTDPGCPYCNKEYGLSTASYFDITYHTEILNEVYANGNYYFDKGNFIIVRVIKRDCSLLTKLQNMFFKTAMLGRKKQFTYGGEVSV